MLTLMAYLPRVGKQRRRSFRMKLGASSHCPICRLFATFSNPLQVFGPSPPHNLYKDAVSNCISKSKNIFLSVLKPVLHLLLKRSVQDLYIYKFRGQSCVEIIKKTSFLTDTPIPKNFRNQFPAWSHCHRDAILLIARVVTGSLIETLLSVYITIFVTELKSSQGVYIK